jgi:predicted metal-binding membrane protein
VLEPIADEREGRFAPAQAAGAGAAATAAVLLATALLSAGSWALAVRQAGGMDMGVATRLGSFGFFLAIWVAMMAAMMLPGAIPAVIRRVRAGGSARSAPAFIWSYLAVWAIVGVVIYALYRPHGTLAAGVVVEVAGVYELAPLKRHFRRRCRESIRSGFRFGLCCVGSSIGLMAMLVVLGVMSIAWMSAITVLVIAQKLLPSRLVLDIPLALAMIGLGALILVAPAVVPGLVPGM